MDPIEMVAQLMALIATTAPKSKGEDFVRTRILSDDALGPLVQAIHVNWMNRPHYPSSFNPAFISLGIYFSFLPSPFGDNEGLTEVIGIYARPARSFAVNGEGAQYGMARQKSFSLDR